LFLFLSFTYHGFRYVELEGYPGTPGFDTLEAQYVHSAVKRTGEIQLSSNLLNEIQRGVVETQESNLHSIPTDCPQREKRGWMGDAQWTSLEATYNFDMAAFYTNFLRSIRDIQKLQCQRDVLPSSPIRPDTYLCCNGSEVFGCREGYVWEDVEVLFHPLLHDVQYS